MPHVGDLGDDLRILVQPYGVRTDNSLRVLRLTWRTDPIEIQRSADLQPEQCVWLHKGIQNPRGPIVVVAGVSSSTDHVPAAVADASLIIEVPAACGDRSLRQRADEMHREELATELHHLRPADGRL